MFAPVADYDAVKAEFQTESIQRQCQNNIYLVVREEPEMEEQANEIYRSQEIVRRHRSDPDQEVRQYCDGQTDQAARVLVALSATIGKAIRDGSFVFRGQTTAVSSLDQDSQTAVKAQLQSAAERVFERYTEAPVRADTGLAEQLLRAADLRSVSSKIDPLSLVKISSGIAAVDTSHKALVSITDWVAQNGSVQGRILSDHFSKPSFGWSPDTIRYLIAALLIAGAMKLNVAGKTVTVAGQQAIDALKSNNAFKNIGVSLQTTQPKPKQLALAAKRLTDLSGTQVMPTPAEIGKAASAFFTSAQSALSSLPDKLRGLGLGGGDMVEDLLQDLSNSLGIDCSDAVTLMGAQQYTTYATIQWASEVVKALKTGMQDDIESLASYSREATAFPDHGVLGDLKAGIIEVREQVEPYLGTTDFHLHGPDVSTALTQIEQFTAQAVLDLMTHQADAVRSTLVKLQDVSGWSELTQSEQSNLMGSLEATLIDVEPTLTSPALKDVSLRQACVRLDL